MAQRVVLKFFLGEDIRRWTCGGDLNFDDLTKKASELYGFPENQMQVVFKYEDSDKDMVTLACESDLQEMLAQALPVVRIHVTKPAEPKNKQPKSGKDADWGSNKLDRVLNKKLNPFLLAGPENMEAMPNAVTLMLRICNNADASGLRKTVAHIQGLMAGNPSVTEKVTLLANTPADLEVQTVPVAVQMLAIMACQDSVPAAPTATAPTTGRPANAAEGSSDSENENGKWRPAKLSKYLERLSKFLSCFDDTDPGKCRKLVKMVSRGSWKVDWDGRAKITTCLQIAAADNPAVGRFLSSVASSPEGGFSSGPARRLAMEAIGSQSDAPPTHCGVTCDACDKTPIVGKRFKSTTRPDFDLCEACYAINQDGDTFLEVSSLQVPQASAPAFFGPRHHAGRGWGGRGRGAGRHHFGGRHAWGPGMPPLPAWAMAGHHGPPVRGRDGAQEKPQVRMVADVSIPDDTKLYPGQAFTKVWRVRNSGSSLPWDPHRDGLVLVHVGGDKMSVSESPVPQCPNGPPGFGEEVELSVDLVAPEQPGRYVAYFRMARAAQPEPMRFGGRIWVQIMVVDPPGSITMQPLTPNMIAGLAGVAPVAASLAAAPTEPTAVQVPDGATSGNHSDPASDPSNEWVTVPGAPVA